MNTTNNELIKLSHGGGGRETSRLINDLITKHLGNETLNKLEDGAVLEGGEKLVFTTDSFVVKPLFFPGGNIGKLAVCGTVNDIAVMGGIPKYLSLGLIIEEGLPLTDLETILVSIAVEAEIAGVQVVCGDTKVVERGSGDGIFINTAGIGILREKVHFSVMNAKPGDAILVSGNVGEHGAAILGARKVLDFTADLESDCAVLTPLVDKLIEAGCDIHTIRDATRGGVAAVVNELGVGSDVTVVVEEGAVPSTELVDGVCSLLGMFPIELANEGKLVIAVAGDDAEKALAALQSDPLGENAAIIGTVEEKGRFPAVRKTPLGVRQILEMPRGEQLPRIC